MVNTTFDELAPALNGGLKIFKKQFSDVLD